MELPLLVEDFAFKQMQQVLIPVLDLLLRQIQQLDTSFEIVHLVFILRKTEQHLLGEKCLVHLLDLVQQGD